MWLYGALPLGAAQVQSAALGGSAVTPQQGTAKADRNVALGGEASTCSAGTLVANRNKLLMSREVNQDSLELVIGGFNTRIVSARGTMGAIAESGPDRESPLVGEESTTDVGTVLAPRTFALSGIASTPGQGTVVAGNRPTTITTTALVPATGTLVFEQAGDPVTVNLNAGEMEMLAFAGDVAPATGLTGAAITSATGTAGVDNLPTDTLLGMSITSGIGVVAVVSDVEDTFIQSSSGAIAFVESFALTGIELTGSQGTLTASGDLQLALTGEEDVFAAGSFAGFTNEFALTGQEILGQQDDTGFGLPEEITLSGIESVVSAGSVFLDNDRSYPLVGEATLVQDGITFASSLAFLSSGLITIEQFLFETVVELTGEQANFAQGRFERPQRDAGDPGKGKGRDKPRKTVIVDGQTFHVNEEELQDLVLLAGQIAQAKAEEEASIALAKAKADKSIEKVRLKVPGVTGSDELKAAITDVYMQAQIDAQVALEVSRARQLDEEEAIVLLLVN